MSAMAQTEKPFCIDSGGGPCDPALYDIEAFAEGVETFEEVTDTWIERYQAQGYLVVHRAFTLREVEAAKQGVTDLIKGSNPAFRGIQYEAVARDILPTLTDEQREGVVRKLMQFTPYDARLQAIAEHPRLLALLTRLLGGTPELLQDMALLKPPGRGREKPWHQDNAYFAVPWNTHVIGVWIALDRATPENGCMHILPGMHRAGPFLHFQRRDWQICDADMRGRRCTAVPLEPGGCLFFHGLLPHGTPPNRSPHRRRALQFHYLAAGAPRCTEEERLAVFGGEGQNVAC